MQWNMVGAKLDLRKDWARGTLSKEKLEKEQAKYVKLARAKFNKLASKKSIAFDILNTVKKQLPGRSNAGKRKNRWTKLAKGVPEIMSFAEYVSGPQPYGLYTLRDYVIGDIKLKEAHKKIEDQSSKWFRKNVMLEGTRQTSEAGWHEEFLQFLPPNVSFKLGPEKEIVELVESFGREKKTWQVFARKLAFIAKNFNKMVKEIRNDMNSGDEVARLCGLMMAITIETGLRPGAVGNSISLSDIDTGQEIEIETFGITTLKPEHVQFVKNNFVKFEFKGKMGTVNIANLEDREIASALKVAVKEAMDGKLNGIFVSKNGDRVDDYVLRKYLKEKWGDITPTDFRKLRSTEEFYKQLKSRTEEMRKILAKKVKSAAGDIKDQVIGEIVSTLRSAFEDAQRSLSHKNWKTTMQTYVDPRLVLNFLSQGGLQDSLNDILIKNANVTLTFDFRKFIEKRKIASAVVSIQKQKSSNRSKSIDGFLDEIDDILINLNL